MSGTMDIEKVREVRLQLEQQILDVLRKFEQTTGARVEAVSLHLTLPAFPRGDRRVIGVEIDARI